MTQQLLKLIANRFVGGDSNEEQSKGDPSHPTNDWQTVKAISDKPKHERTKEQNDTHFAKLPVLDAEPGTFVVDRLQLLLVTFKRSLRMTGLWG